MDFDRDYWLDQFSQWSDLARFEGLVDDCDIALGQFGAMIHHGTGFWRDAWIASRYAELVEADKVRLVHPELAPDFEILIGDTEHQFEATEVLDPRRRRGAEYRDIVAKIDRGESTDEDDPAEDWLTPELATSELQKAATKKAKKAYAHARQCGLVIYLNMSEYGFDEDVVLAAMKPATRIAGKSFRSVDILWHEQLYRVW